MITFVFLAFCFFGNVFGARLSAKCEQERRYITECFTSARIDPDQWDEKGFQNLIPNYKTLLECVGKPICEYNQKSFEAFKLLFEYRVFWSENLVDCLGNNKYERMKLKCWGREKAQCDDPKFYRCLINEIRNHKDCTEKDALAFDSKTDDMIKNCVLEREAYELIKIEF